jgi:LysR family transcriptional regulator, nitrogen assimilation regulatory protein
MRKQQPLPTFRFSKLEKPTADLGALACVVEVARRGKLSTAAIALGLSPSAVSKKIAAVEKQYGERLFLRTGRGLAPTDVADDILPLIRGLLQAEAHLGNVARARRGRVAGQVRVGLVSSAAYLSVDLFKAIRTSYPLIRLVLAEGLTSSIENDLAAGRIDIGVMSVHGESGTRLGRRGDFVGVQPLYLVGPSPPGAALSDTVPFSDLGDLPLAMTEETGLLRQTLDQVARRLGVRLNIVVEANSSRVLAELVARGGVHSIMSIYTIPRYLTSPDIVVRKLVKPEIRRFTDMRFAKSRPMTAAVRHVADTLRLLLTSQLDRPLPKR